LFFLSLRHCALWIRSWRSNSSSKFLSGRSETSVGCGTKKATWNVESWLLHYDAPALTVLSIRQLTVKHKIPTPPQSPYSPDLSPPDFFLFPNLKITL
jgi:hypothetical protein